MRISEKIRNISPDPFCQECADEVVKLEEALLISIEESDWCYVCSSHGYAHDTNDCPMKDL